VIYSQDAIEACVKLTVAMSERFLPDKAIDALDERVHAFTSLILKFKKSSRFRTSIKEIRELKRMLKSKNTKRLQNLEMRNASKRISNCPRTMGRRCENNRIEVTEDNADVVSMMTGIPVNRIAQTESNKPAILPELIESKVTQKEAFLKLRDRFREIVRD
jgi:ATP-dependent Clp protease ATP-binding subunit ClpC